MRHGVAVGQHIANLAATDASLQVKLTGQGLCRELLLGHVREHLVSVDEHTMTTHGALVGDAILVKFLGQILHLVDAGLQHVKLRILVKTNGYGIEVATVETTIGQVALIRNAEALCSLVPVLFSRSDKSTHIDDGVLLAGHGGSIGVGIHLQDNLLDSLVGVARLTGLDEIGVLGKTG